MSYWQLQMIFLELRYTNSLYQHHLRVHFYAQNFHIYLSLFIRARNYNVDMYDVLEMQVGSHI